MCGILHSAPSGTSDSGNFGYFHVSTEIPRFPGSIISAKTLSLELALSGKFGFITSELDYGIHVIAFKNAFDAHAEGKNINIEDTRFIDSSPDPSPAPAIFVPTPRVLPPEPSTRVPLGVGLLPPALGSIFPLRTVEELLPPPLLALLPLEWITPPDAAVALVGCARNGCPTPRSRFCIIGFVTK